MNNLLKYVVPTITEKPEQRKWGAPGPESDWDPTITDEERLQALLIHCRTSYEQAQSIR